MKKELKNQLKGLADAIQIVIYDKTLRDNFMDNPVVTLEQVGVQFEDRELQERFVKELRDTILTDIQFVEGPGTIDPVGPVADMGATIVTGVVTGAATGAATYAATKSSIIDEEIQFSGIKLNYAQIGSLKRLKESQIRIAGLERDLRSNLEELKNLRRRPNIDPGPGF